MSSRFVVASSPHIHAPLDTRKIMAWVLAALLPAGAAGVWFLGLSSVWVIVTCVVVCVGSEYLWQKLAGQPVTVSDLSAAVTGLLLAYNLPPSVPLWMAACGSVFAIVLVKQFFGGLGGNIVNPALAARAMMLISWPVAMTTWTVQGVSGATPLGLLKGMAAASESSVAAVSQATGAAVSAASAPVLPSWWDLLVGNVGGCIGETSAAALLLGGALLVWKGIVSWRIPTVYIGTVAVLSLAFGRAEGPFYEVLAGGLMLGAVFMATDYTTSPMTAKGQYVFAAGCGLLTALIRTFGGYPEGVSYSILIMNLTVPLIDRMTVPRILGEAKR
ncbi:RnfABCDGE type electron transport complex subunit D [Fretibacterium sp. OH1220_COT-178]|uniref:RnfABCDGE type electron transport complex subunit D n=1 Tax=Fretibacterium sp. OH1220_COT-178 TaxID=2491047 RepID=UPI000F5FB64F|nr:RnfABCDGE type electron transport complex subunit D [Fretibacterium sp. OH1220_COT-178]RRD65131.1 RnfABCDGE type electron transport complex subunit D [Fretibacterium sp. OH1220_COT-178]